MIIFHWDVWLMLLGLLVDARLGRSPTLPQCLKCSGPLISATTCFLVGLVRLIRPASANFASGPLVQIRQGPSRC